MFTRNAEKDELGSHNMMKPFPSNGTPAPTSQPPQPSALPLKSAAPGATTNSVIGRDLAIIGAGLKIVSKGTLQVDGEVQGDVLGQKVVIGPTGKVTGLVNAENVVIQGAVYGTIKGVDVRLAASSIVEGDVYHQSFTLEQGASFEGRSRRPTERAELLPDLTPAADQEFVG